jgi:hypothetical protein
MDSLDREPTIPEQDQGHGLLRPGLELSGFRLDSKLGRGGMGELWKTWDLTGERFVVLKFVPPHVQPNLRICRGDQYGCTIRPCILAPCRLARQEAEIHRLDFRGRELSISMIRNNIKKSLYVRLSSLTLVLGQAGKPDVQDPVACR